MTDDDLYTAAVYPAVLAIAKRRRLTDDQTADAVSLAWWAFRNRKANVPVGAYAVWACRQAMYGRALPGTNPSVRDALSRPGLIHAGGAGGLVDRSPGPDQTTADREAWGEWVAQLSARELHIVACVLEGMSGTAIARRLRLSPGRVSQIRRELVERFAA